MFRCKNVDFSKMYSNGRITKVQFGKDKPYPKTKTIKRIIALFDYYMEKYPHIKIDMLADTVSTEKVMEKNILAQYKYNTESQLETGSIIFNSDNINKLTNWNMLERTGVPQERKRQSNGKWNLETIPKKYFLQYIMIHEFAHAIEHQVDAVNDEEIKTLFSACNGDEKFKNCHEFIAECFVTSELVSGDKTADAVRKRIDQLVTMINE